MIKREYRGGIHFYSAIDEMACPGVICTFHDRADKTVQEADFVVAPQEV
jgi:hypothetical protein